MLSGCGEKIHHSQGVQEPEFALVGIGIALLRSHAQKAAFALNRSGDFAVAGREIAFITESAGCTRLALNTMSLLYLEPQFVPVRLSTAAHLHSERKRLEGRTRSNKASACLMRDRCSALRECVSERGSDPSWTSEKKTPTRR